MDWTPAQPRIIPHTSERTAEPPSDLGCEGVWLTALARCSRVFAWLRGQDEGIVAIVDELMKHRPYGEMTRDRRGEPERKRLTLIERVDKSQSLDCFRRDYVKRVGTTTSLWPSRCRIVILSPEQICSLLKAGSRAWNNVSASGP